MRRRGSGGLEGSWDREGERSSMHAAAQGEGTERRKEEGGGGRGGER